MGLYINPGNTGFAVIRNGRYIDKSGLIRVVDERLDTPRKFTCVSRPRRFGKSYDAKMLCAYYDCSCDSSALFNDLAIAKSPLYSQRLNTANVIYVDMTRVKREADDAGASIPAHLSRELIAEARQLFPKVAQGTALTDTLVNVAETDGRRFVMIVDEWDTPIRELSQAKQQDYLEFLRLLFKSSDVTDRIFSAVYMTGILPIKKDMGQSSLSDFREYSMLRPGPFSSYTGFLEAEVETLCAEANMDLQEMKRWYDGYQVGGVSSVYNPYAVVSAVDEGAYGSHWRHTSVADALKTYIDLDFDGLQGDVVRLMAGERILVDTGDFKNDPALVESRDDALTLTVHLGYLTFEEDFNGTGWVRIPNQEVRTEFEKMLRKAEHPELVRLVRASDTLLQDTIALDGAAVAAAVARVHDSNYVPQFYNGEQALRHTVKMAYISSVDRYARVEELPTGRGLADLVYLPRQGTALPAMVIELKWDGNTDGAIAQIKARDYAALPAELFGEVLLVGIVYDRATKTHRCTIEKVEVQR